MTLISKSGRIPTTSAYVGVVDGSSLNGDPNNTARSIFNKISFYEP